MLGFYLRVWDRQATLGRSVEEGGPSVGDVAQKSPWGNTKLNMSEGSQKSARWDFWRKGIRHEAGEVEVHKCWMGTVAGSKGQNALSLLVDDPDSVIVGSAFLLALNVSLRLGVLP